MVVGFAGRAPLLRAPAALLVGSHDRGVHRSRLRLRLGEGARPRGWRQDPSTTSETAIAAAQQGTVPVARDVKLAAALPTYQPATAATAVATVTQAPAGAVVVECVQDGGRLRVHVVSEGYDTSWKVQFPRAIREPGARYVVDALHPAAGGFYRVRGDIRRLL
jgi:hypothetical protein